jgi:flagellar protein FlaJ
MEDALNEAVEFIPSLDFRRVLWQIINSLRTGSDIGSSITSVIDQINREHGIEVRRYGRKLNPLAMFYMIIAVILPSLGVTMLIVLSSFVQFELNLSILLVVVFLLGFVQFMFLAIIKFSRPSIEIE